ncbi:hypothetical protein GCK72_003752 [Caenorhabditis remanei]|uniref:F-box associated domain-containing protein n=1 Tax=Caenorhabditis remanei TaxID=31234 RepID=A0A6A5H998_CAERE|nr:hypothetical protein GCK72_003752 [Caenorhabditis remanei]KAF1763807.1 hypothetical protein GCK72_003752 [Caenorhabditis remanei]
MGFFEKRHNAVEQSPSPILELVSACFNGLFKIRIYEPLNLVSTNRLLEHKWEKFSLCGGKVKEAELQCLMNIAGPEASFEVIRCKIPEKFRHEKAFSFKSIIYDDAHWIQIEDLFNLQNADVVKIGDNNDFTNSEYNMLIEHWISHEEDMFKKLEIGRKRTGALHIDWVLEDVVFLEVDGGIGMGEDEETMYCFLAKNTTNRTQTVACVYWKNNTFHMQTFTPQEFGREEEYSILKYLNEQENLNLISELKQIKQHQAEFMTTDSEELVEIFDKKCQIVQKIDELQDNGIPENSF